MATAATIKKNIAKLEAALKSKATPKSLKPKLETQLVKSKAELSGMNKGTKPKTSSTKSTQTALQKLKAMVNKNKKYKTYKGAGVDLEKDADRPALRTGKRIAKESGKTYYEYRANRIDVKQPPKKYPKLEKGGYMAEGGEVSHKYYVTYVSQSFDGKNYKNGFDLYSTNGDADEEIFIGNYSKLEEANKVAENKGLERLPMYMRMAKGGYMAEGGMSQGYDDREDERLGMEHGKISSKDLDSTHARRDDARFEERMAKGGYYAEGGRIKVGTFNEEQLINKEDKKAVEKAREETGLKYVDTKIIKKGGKMYMEVYLIPNEEYYNSSKFAKGGEVNDFYDNLQVHVQGVGTIYHGQSMKAAIKKADAYLLKNPKAEVVIVDDKYGDEYDLEGNQIENEYEYAKGGYMAEGGISEKEVVESNAEMVLSQIKAVKHHAQELSNVVSKNSDIEAWVVAKIERASTDLSDITHYLEFQTKKMAMGGEIHRTQE